MRVCKIAYPHTVLQSRQACISDMSGDEGTDTIGTSEEMVDKDKIITELIVAHFGFNATTAKHYLRQLTEFGSLEPHGGNKNRTYSKK